MNPIVRVLPHLTDAASLPDCAAGAAARSGVAYAPATIASAAPSASKAAVADALLLIRFLLECLPRTAPRREHPEDPHRPGSAVLDAVQLVRRKVEARSCLERDGTPADVRGSLARDDVSHLVVAVAMEGRLARLDDAHELGHVEAPGVLVHEVPEGPLARGVELGL